MGELWRDFWKRMVTWILTSVSLVFSIAVILFLVAWMSGPTDVWDVPIVQFVSGTEYNLGDAGQVIVEARYANGTSAFIIGPACNITIWYPDKSVFLNQSVATSGGNGNQYIGFTVPNVTGVYEYQAECLLVGNTTGVISKSFHVSEFQNDTSTKLNRVKAVIKG